MAEQHNTKRNDLAQRIAAGERRALAQGITLVESTRADHRGRAEALLAALMARTGGAMRLGISGAPGVGKSTFIEAFGTYLTGLGHRVAVLAVDPTSPRSGGSILGDKTRMPELARDPAAFIRPSPAGRSLGGVARRSREAMLLAEAAGHDVVIIETVGVGQAEIAVEDMVDGFLLLVSPGGGDELQGLKRGVMEFADLIVVTKADGTLQAAARQVAAEHASALTLIRPKSAAWTAEVLSVSALAGSGIEAVWEAAKRHLEAIRASGELERRRRAQARRWMWSEIEHGLREAFDADKSVAKAVAELEAAVGEGRVAPTVAARQLLALFSRSD